MSDKQRVSSESGEVSQELSQLNPETWVRSQLVTTRKGVRVVTPIGLEAIEQMAAAGLSKETISKSLGVSRATLLRMSERQSEVEQVLQEGRGALQDTLVALLKANAMQGSVASAIFLLKSMCGFSDVPGKSSEAPAPAALAVNVVIPTFTPDQFQAFLASNVPKAVEVIENAPQPQS